MIDRTLLRCLALAGILSAVCGCQQTGPKSWFRWPWSKTAKTEKPSPSLLSSVQHQDLSGAQKADMQIVLARGMERQGRFEEARDMYLKALKADPDRADAYHRLGILHIQLGDTRTAESYYRQAVQRDGENAELHCDMGYGYYLQQRWDEAEACLRHAISLAPGLHRAHNNLGLVLARQGRKGEAFEEFARAGCNRAEAHANLGYALALSERWDEARWEYQRALEANPNLATAREGLNSLRSLTARRPAGHSGHARSGPPSHAALTSYAEPAP
jgi:Tfp pilus assembly protein PilF